MRVRAACALFVLGTSLAHGASAFKGRLEWLHQVEMREAKVYSRGVEAARVEVQGAVYELDVVFDRRPDELLRPSEVVQVVLP